MNITIKTIEQFEKESGYDVYVGYGLNTFTDEPHEFLRYNDDFKKAMSIQIYGHENNVCFNTHFLAPKNKEITVAYLFDKVDKYLNRENAYRNIRSIFEKMLPSYNFYATSYGIGMDALFKSHESVKREANKLCQYLNDNGIEFYNEYSDASWVYRFVISKSASNLEKIKLLTDKKKCIT